MYTTYVIMNDGGKIYIGYTKNFESRLRRHNGELPTKKSSYTYKEKQGKWRPIYKEEFTTKIEALKREKQLKSCQGRKFIKNLKINKAR